MQKKLTVLFAFAIFVLVLGWAITPVQAEDCKGKHKKDPDCDGKGGGGPEGTPLCVTFGDAPGDRVTSDGEMPEEYCNHVGSTGLVTLSSNGTFIFASSGKGATRRFGLDFTDCVTDDQDCGSRDFAIEDPFSVDHTDLASFNIHSDSHIDLTDTVNFPVGTDPMDMKSVGLAIRFTLEGDEKIT